MERVTAQFTNFIVVGDKDVTSQIYTLDGIVQQLEHHNNVGPTVEAKAQKLKSALNIVKLKDLWLSVSMLDNPTYEQIYAERASSTIPQWHRLSRRRMG